MMAALYNTCDPYGAQGRKVLWTLYDRVGGGLRYSVGYPVCI